MSGKDIAAAFRSASREAVKAAHAHGLSVTFKRGKRIVRRSASGEETTLRELDRAYARPTRWRYKIEE